MTSRHPHSCCCEYCTGELNEPDAIDVMREQADDEQAAAHWLETQLDAYEAARLDNDPFADKPIPEIGDAL